MNDIDYAKWQAQGFCFPMIATRLGIKEDEILKFIETAEGDAHPYCHAIMERSGGESKVIGCWRSGLKKIQPGDPDAVMLKMDQSFVRVNDYAQWDGGCAIGKLQLAWVSKAAWRTSGKCRDGGDERAVLQRVAFSFYNDRLVGIAATNGRRLHILPLDGDLFRMRKDYRNAEHLCLTLDELKELKVFARERQRWSRSMPLQFVRCCEQWEIVGHPNVGGMCNYPNYMQIVPEDAPERTVVYEGPVAEMRFSTMRFGSAGIKGEQIYSLTIPKRADAPAVPPEAASPTEIAFDGMLIDEMLPRDAGHDILLSETIKVTVQDAVSPVLVQLPEWSDIARDEGSTSLCPTAVLMPLRC
jgi:hypothetical protein